MQNSKRQHGFTLIELITVIVIIGIIAAVAVPKFVDLRRAAIVSTMEGMRSAVESATTMTYAFALTQDLHLQPSATMMIGGDSVELVYGFPSGTANGIAKLIQYPSQDWQSRASTFAGAWVYWHGVIDEDAGDAQCYLRYRQSTAAGARPVIDFVSTGC